MSKRGQDATSSQLGFTQPVEREGKSSAGLVNPGNVDEE